MSSLERCEYCGDLFTMDELQGCKVDVEGVIVNGEQIQCIKLKCKTCVSYSNNSDNKT